MILKNEKGFTLIELIMIIVILGILAAVAVPKYISLQTDARSASGAGWIGGLKSAIAIDWAGFQLGKAGTVGTGVTTLALAEGLLDPGSARPSFVYQDGAAGWYVDINGSGTKTAGTDECYAFTAATATTPASVGAKTTC